MATDPTTPKLSLSEIAERTPVEMNDFANAGRTLNFSAKGADRYLTYGSKAYGQLGYNPYRDNESKYQQETPWTKDISRGFNGMIKLAGVGLSDSFAFGAFGSEENHKDFGKVMADYGSQRKEGSTAFWANTMLSSGYTVGIITAVAAEELLLAGATALSGGLASGVTAPLMAAEAARAGSLLTKAAKLDSKISLLSRLRNIEGARMFHNTVASFGKSMLPLGNTADYLRLFKPAEHVAKDMTVAAANFKSLNGLTKTVMGAAALARDARKIYLSHSESKLEANFVRDEIKDEAVQKWQLAHPGETMPREVEDHINAKAQASYDKAYSANFGLIYLTNAITFEGMFKGFSPTNTLFRTIDNYAITGKGFRDVTVKALNPSIKSYVTKKLSSVTLPGAIKGTVQASMEGVQEYGQDVISSAAKKYGGVDFNIEGYETDDKGKVIYRDKYNEKGEKVGKEKIPIYGEIKDSAKSMSLGAYWDQVANSLGDSSFETFASGALMGIFASPVNFASKVASEYSFGERGFGSEYNAWTKEGREKHAELWKQREQSAEIMTQFFRSQGASFEADVNATSHRMIGLREQMLEAAKNGDQKLFEDKKTEIFQLGMRELFKNGMHTELIDHLDQMKGYSAKELNESLDRLDITEDNKSEFLEKIEKRKSDISTLKKEYDRINIEMPSKGSVDAVLRNPNLNKDEKQEKVLEILAWESLKEQMLFAGDNIRNFAERKKGIINKLKENTKLTDPDIASLTNREDLKQQIELLEEQIASNKEYKLDNTKDHQKALIKLNALKDLQEGFVKLDDPKFDSTMESAVEKVYSSMEDAFGRYMLAVNTELNAIPNADSLASDKNLYSRHIKKFKDLFDFYQIDEDQRELEYYADTLNDPKSATKWLETRKAFLAEMGNNKKAYIERSIGAWQERMVSDKMMSELLENGIIFELDELNDLFEKGVMPSRLYDVDTQDELSPEKYKLAAKIIEKSYKNLTGKKIKGFTSAKDFGARSKAKRDRRKASGLVTAYAGKNKLNTPIPIKDFIDSLLSKGTTYLTKSEYALLEKLRSLPFSNNVILSDSADGPMTFNEEGDLVLDIRFGAADYVLSELPFEYVAIAGLVQNIFSEKLKSNEQFSLDLMSIMGEVKQAYIAQLTNDSKDSTQLRKDIAGVSTSTLFNNPLVFIAEAFTNKDFQLLLAGIQSDINAENVSIWKDLTRTLRMELQTDIRGTMLDQVLGIAQLNLSEAQIEAVVESPSVAEQETQETQETADQEATVEEEAEVETEEETEIELPTETAEERSVKKVALKNQIAKLQKDVAGLQTQKNKTSSLKFRTISNITKSIKKLNLQIEELANEYIRLEAIDKVVAPTSDQAVPGPNTTVSQTDSEGSVIITSSSKFDTLPEELQFLLAKQYYINQSKAVPPMRELLDSLSAEDITAIEDSMALPSFVEIIGKYNTQQPVPVTTVEELDEEDDLLSRIVFSDAAEKELEATKNRAYAGIVTTSTGATTVFLNHLGVEETITASSEADLRKIIADTYSIEGWANNTNNIVGETFVAQIGDVATPVEIFIGKVKLLPDGTIQVQAIRTDNDKEYDINVNPVNGKIRSYTALGTKSKTADRNDFIDGFLGSAVVEPFDPGVTSTQRKSKNAQPKFNIFTTVQEIKNEYVGIENYFADNELEIISTELSNITDAKEYAEYLQDIGEALNQRMRQAALKDPVSTDAKVDVISSDLDFNEKEKNTRANWKSLIVNKAYDYTGDNEALRKKYKLGKSFWRINQRDLDYIRYSAFGLFSLPREEFLNAVLERLYDIEVYSISVKNIDSKLPTAEVEQIVIANLKYALEKNLAGSKVITALNKKLSEAKSDKVIKYNLRFKTSKSPVLITTKSKSQKTKKLNNKALLYKDVQDHFMVDGDVLTKTQAMYRLYDALTTRKVHPDILGYIVGRVKAGELKAYSSLLSKDSNYKTADGFEDEILDGVTITGSYGDLTGGNLFTELLGIGTTLSEMREYFVDEYLKEMDANLGAEGGPVSDEDLLEEYLTSNAKGEQDFSIQTDYESSVEYQILTGQYSGDYNSLTPKQQELFNTVNDTATVSGSAKIDLKNKYEQFIKDEPRSVPGGALTWHRYRSLIEYAAKHLPTFKDVPLEMLRDEAVVSEGIDYYIKNHDILNKFRKASAEEIDTFLYLIDDLIYSKLIAATHEKGAGEELVDAYITAIEALKEIAEPFLEKSDKINESGQVDDFFSFLPEVTTLEKRFAAYTQKFQGLDNKKQVQLMFSEIEKISNIEDLMLMHRLINNPVATYTKDQIKTVNDAIRSRVETFQEVSLNEGIVTVELSSIDLGNGIVLPAGTYMLQSNSVMATGIGLRITDVVNQTPYTVNVLDLMGAVTNIYAPGEIINSQTIDLSLTNEDNEDIKASVKDIFSNFNSNVSEFENLTDEDLLNEINKEFNNCK